jgi:hypothetical protein
LVEKVERSRAVVRALALPAAVVHVAAVVEEAA